MEPAKSIIDRVGGIDTMVGITGVHRTRVYGWAREKASGGTGGLIPQKHHVAILNYAKENGLEISAEDFLPRQVAGADA